MKRLLFICMGFGLLASCQQKVELTPHEPQVTFNVPAYAASFRGGKVYLTLHTEAKAGLFTMKVLHSLNGATEITDTLFNLSGETFVWPFVYTVPDIDSLPATIRLFFVISDLQGRSASASFVITVSDDPVALGAVHNGVVYNRNAPARNAQWDLVNNASRQLADSLDYDLMNITPTGSSALVKGWRSPLTSSFTEMTRVSGLDFNLFTAKELINTWNNPLQSHFTQVSSLAVGDMLVVWLRNGAYGIIKITQIDDTTPGADNQYIRFTYKKQE